MSNWFSNRPMHRRALRGLGGCRWAWRGSCAPQTARGVRAKFRQGVARCEQRVFLNFDLAPFAFPVASALWARTQHHAGPIWYTSHPCRSSSLSTKNHTEPIFKGIRPIASNNKAGGARVLIVMARALRAGAWAAGVWRCALSAWLFPSHRLKTGAGPSRHALSSAQCRPGARP